MRFLIILNWNEVVLDSNQNQTNLDSVILMLGLSNGG